MQYITCYSHNGIVSKLPHTNTEYIHNLPSFHEDETATAHEKRHEQY